MAFETRSEFPPVDKERDARVLPEDRKGQRQWYVRHIAPADIEEPRNRFRHRQHDRRDALPLQRAAKPGACRLRAFSGKTFGMRHYRRDRRRRLSWPGPVERIVG